MIPAKLVGVAATVTAAGTVGQAIAPVANPISNPSLFDLFGTQVPVIPVLIGVLTAFLVRVIVITSSPHKLWSYNAAVTLVAMLGAATFITDRQIGPGMSFWIGGGFGALGVGIIEIAKSRLTAMMGIPTEKPDDGTKK